MGNLAGVTALFAVALRPGLLVPHIAVSDIRLLDWRALYRAGVRYVVLDKDNCLTKPLHDRLVPAIDPALRACLRTFGPCNVVIVSNSAGSSDDAGSVGAEHLSRTLLQRRDADGEEAAPVQVMLHAAKKPSGACAREVVRWAAGEGTAPVRAPDGHVLVIGDRPTTDVVLAHRIAGALRRHAKTAEAPAARPTCVAALTTSIWAKEGWGTTAMRRAEGSILRALVRAGVQPGGPWSRASRRPPTPAADAHASQYVDPNGTWQRLAVLPALPASLDVPSEDFTDFPYTHDPLPSTRPQRDAPLSLALLASLPPAHAARLQRAGLFLSHAAQSWPFRPLLGALASASALLSEGLALAARQTGLDATSRPRAVSAVESPLAPRRPRTLSTLQRAQRTWGRISTLYAPPARRTFHTSRIAHSQSPLPKDGPVPRTGSIWTANLPLRNWLAALAALAVLPLGWFGGVELHDWRERRAARTLEAQMKREVEEASRTGEDEGSSEARAERARRKSARIREESLQRLALSRYHLEHDRAEILDKLERVRERRAEEAAREEKRA